MLQNGKLWKERFSTVFIPQIELYRDVWREHFLPTLAELDKEAERIARKAYKQFSVQADPECSDAAEITEQAHDAGFEYYDTMATVRQGLINIYPIGLYHLVEQQVLLFFRECLASFPNEIAWKLEHVKTKLKECKIDLNELPCWPRVVELRDLANCRNMQSQQFLTHPVLLVRNGISLVENLSASFPRKHVRSYGTNDPNGFRSGSH